jgi:predicted regulator of Ras-like GTPase activity (Roadblock/LC7/MglB family)
MSEVSGVSGVSRSELLDRALTALLSSTPEIEAAAVVSFDGLPMASALPGSMDEDRVAAMSAALLSLGERAAQGLGRGELSQVYIEGETGTVFLVSADNEAVLVAVAQQGAKAGLMLYEVRRAAAAVAAVLRVEDAEPLHVPEQALPQEPAHVAAAVAEPVVAAVPDAVPDAAEPAAEPQPVAAPSYAAAPVSYLSPLDAGWSSSYAPSGSVLPPQAPGASSPTWS